MRFAIYGTGGFGREVAPLARAYLDGRLAIQDEPSGSVVFVDDAEDSPEQCNGYPVIGFDELTPEDRIVVAIGDGRTREKVERKCEAAGLRIAGISGPTVCQLDEVEIGPGAVLCDGVILTSNIKIGRSFQANLSSYIGHDCVIGDYVTFAPAVRCNGNVHIGDYAYIGTGAMFSQGKPGRPMTVGEGAIVGMGSVVTKPVEPYTMVFGSPAKVIRTLKRPE